MPERVATMSCEDIVATVWELLLGTPIADRDQGFFDLGADSGMVLHAAGLLRGRWPELKVVHVFRHPTVNALAAFLDGRG